MPDKNKKASPAQKTKNTKGRSLAVKLGFKSATSKKVGVKEKSSKRPGRGKPGFALYSSDGDNSVNMMNKDLDKCTNILNQLIATKHEKQKKSPDPVKKKGSKKSAINNEEMIDIPTNNQNGDQQPAASRVLWKETLMEVRTPFNNRLVSSTPDPDKILDESNLPSQHIPDTRTQISAPVTMTQSIASARHLMRPLIYAHSSQDQNYVHMHKITDGSVLRHNIVNNSREMTRSTKDLSNHRPEYMAPPCKPDIILKNGKCCYSTDELTFGQRDSESPLDLSSHKATESHNTSSNQRPLSTNSITDLKNKNLINFDSREEQKGEINESRGSNIEDVKCYVEKDEEMTSTPAIFKLQKQTRKSLNNIYEQHGEKRKDFSPKTKDSFGFSSMDDQSSLEIGIPGFHKNLKHFQEAAKISTTNLNVVQPEPMKPAIKTSPTAEISCNQTRFPSSLTHNKFLNIDVGATPMPSPVKMPEPRARAILGRPNHAVSPEADANSDTFRAQESSPPQKISPPRISPPRYFEQTSQLSPQLSPTDDVIDWNRRRDHGSKSSHHRDDAFTSQPMVTPAKLQSGQSYQAEEDEPYINIIDYPKEDEHELIEETLLPERHQISDLPPHFARLSHLSDTPANSPIRFPRPRSYSSSRLLTTVPQDTQTNNISEHPFLQTILDADDEGLGSQPGTNLYEEVRPSYDNELYTQQSTAFPSKPMNALPIHLFHGTPMNSPVRPMFNSRVQSEFKGNNDQAIPTTGDPIGSVKKLRWLLTELLEVCDIDGDPDMCQLAQDLSNTVESIPQLKLTFNIQSEMDVALQPLRSENSQLRRRLRIVNQQLKERERLEKEASMSSGVNFQVLHLQSSNNTLQRQLKDEKASRSKLSKQMEEVEREKEKLKLERQNLLLALGEKDNDRLKLRQENSQENQKLRQDLALAQTRTEGHSLKLEASDRESHILKISLKQRDTEIERLQEVVQTLKEGVNDLLRYSENKDESNGRGPVFSLDKDDHRSNPSLHRLLQMVQHGQYSTSPTKSIHSDPGSVSMPSTNHQIRVTSTTPESSLLTQHALAQHDHMFKNMQCNPKINNYGIVSKDEESHKIDQNANVTDGHEVSKNTNETSRYSVTEYFRKYPSNNSSTENNTITLDTTPRLSSNSTSNHKDVYKGTDLNISLSSIQDDVQSVMSSITESSTSTTVDDTAFREGIATLDANIAKVQEALQRTKKIFS